jgi:hypothetical protein
MLVSVGVLRVARGATPLGEHSFAVAPCWPSSSWCDCAASLAAPLASTRRSPPSWRSAARVIDRRRARATRAHGLLLLPLIMLVNRRVSVWLLALACRMGRAGWTRGPREECWQVSCYADLLWKQHATGMPYAAASARFGCGAPAERSQIPARLLQRMRPCTGLVCARAPLRCMQVGLAMFVQHSMGGGRMLVVTCLRACGSFSATTSSSA